MFLYIFYPHDIMLEDTMKKIHNCIDIISLTTRTIIVHVYTFEKMWSFEGFVSPLRLLLVAASVMRYLSVCHASCSLFLNFSKFKCCHFLQRVSSAVSKPLSTVHTGFIVKC